MARSQVEIPGSVLLALAGGVAWLLGTAALPAGAATVVLAVGLVVTGWLFREVRRRSPARSGRLDRDRRARVVRLLAVGAGIAAVGGLALGTFGLSELAFPLTVLVGGAVLLPMASLVGARAYLALGGALMVLGAAGALLALDSAGPTYPQGVVGMVAGVLLWVTAAQQAGMLADLRHRSRR